MPVSLAQALSEFEQTTGMAEAQLAERLTRIRAELRFAAQLVEAHPEQRQAWQPQVIEATRLLAAGLQRPIVDVEGLTAEAEALLSPLGEAAKRYSLRCVAHAHSDMNWQWAWPETVALLQDTFQTMLRLMEEFPQFIFSQSQASAYAAMEKYDPATFAQIQQRVAEGRWEVMASQWVEGDKNLANGESISRHLLYTRAYFADRFGLTPEDVPIDFEPDTFGHPATLPTILARGGVKYYYHCRGSRGPHLYWWLGRDGSRLLVLNDIQWYMHFNRAWTAVEVTSAIADPLLDFCQATGLTCMPVLYGVGDHGGGPTRRDIHRLLAMATWPIYPRIEFSTLRAFFETAEAQAHDLPEITGERNFVFTGCYTSQARQKEANRHGENLLMTAEAAAVLGEQLAEVPYPQANLKQAWRYLLFSQFHDILPGSGVRATRHYTLGQAQEMQAAAGAARTNALRALARLVDTEALRRGFERDDALRRYKDEQEANRAMGAGVGAGTGQGGESAFGVTRTSDRLYLVFNPLPYERHEIVRAKLWDTQLDPALLVVSAEGMAPQPVQVMGTGHHAGHRYLEVAFPVTVPALGYRAVCVSDRRLEFGLPAPAERSLWDGVGGAARTEPRRTYTMANEFLTVTLEPSSGSVVSLVDKRTGREFVPRGARLGVLQYALEAFEGMSAWTIGTFKERRELVEGGTLTQLAAGPYVQAWRWSRQLGQTTLQLDIMVQAGKPQLDFRLRVDWREVGDRQRGIPNLSVRFPLAIEAPRALYEVPYGALERDLYQGEEVPALRWADLSDRSGYGATLVNTSKYGFSVAGTTLQMTLLRASLDPDPLPDLGDHEIAYALVPHGPEWRIGDMMRAGEEANLPLVVTSCDFHRGPLPTVQAFVSLSPGNVRLGSLKRAESGEGFVLRLVETEGLGAEAVVDLAPALVGEGATAVAVDTLERPLSDGLVKLEGRRLTVAMRPYAIQSVWVRP